MGGLVLALGEVVDGEGQAFSIGQGEDDENDGGDEDGCAGEPNVLRLEEQHGDDDEAGETGGGVIHEPVGVAFERFVFEGALVARFGEVIPADKQPAAAASRATTAQAACEDAEGRG